MLSVDSRNLDSSRESASRLLRWMAKCVRCYALEGGTGDSAVECGFAWAPGFVKNADMDGCVANQTGKGCVPLLHG